MGSGSIYICWASFLLFTAMLSSPHQVQRTANCILKLLSNPLGLIIALPLNSCLPGTCDCDLIWKWGLCRYNRVKTRSCWIRLGPSPMTGFLIRRGRLGSRGTQKEEGHVKTEEEMGLFCHCQWTPKIASKYQKLERSKKRSSPRAFREREHSPANTLTLDFKSRTLREWVSIVLIYPVCGILLWKL